MDADLRSIQEARDLVAQSAAAQRAFAGASQERVDAVVTAMARAATWDLDLACEGSYTAPQGSATFKLSVHGRYTVVGASTQPVGDVGVATWEIRYEGDATTTYSATGGLDPDEGPQSGESKEHIVGTQWFAPSMGMPVREQETTTSTEDGETTTTRYEARVLTLKPE